MNNKSTDSATHGSMFKFYSPLFSLNHKIIYLANEIYRCIPNIREKNECSNYKSASRVWYWSIITPRTLKKIKVGLSVNTYPLHSLQVCDQHSWTKWLHIPKGSVVPQVSAAWGRMLCWGGSKVGAARQSQLFLFSFFFLRSWAITGGCSSTRLIWKIESCPLSILIVGAPPSGKTNNVLLCLCGQRLSSL